MVVCETNFWLLDRLVAAKPGGCVCRVQVELLLNASKRRPVPVRFELRGRFVEGRQDCAELSRAVAPARLDRLSQDRGCAPQRLVRSV